jgi:hypothetical protein
MNRDQAKGPVVDMKGKGQGQRQEIACKVFGNKDSEKRSKLQNIAAKVQVG